ncbi:hypothetical protein MTsPCn9_11840 [Croceitalea sp. MTPC9]|uniref:transmembrane 220 family protein n=1 Tax=unclassified Croceitalea TaxID=2632280 RepID=UPI002B3D0562|nr:hypothetical protein MTsPCn6_31800 [Croceitalea sp. MTPC6]GMN16248.1 hypothetical protein MTsPCn9_11840 [Croceitalea sp. MTPC9]
MNKLFKIIAIIFTVLFIWSAVLQGNDPDAFRWYLIYGMGALASIFFIINQLKPKWGIILAVFYFGFAIYNWPTKFEGFTIDEGDIVNIERAREVGGLFISGFAMLIYCARMWYANKSKV